MSNRLIPDEALELLGQAQWDRSATRELELLSLSFYWTDEMLFEIGACCMQLDPNSYRFKDLWLYRRSLIRNQPNEQYRDVWELVLETCPDWPGFRADRCSTELAAALDSAVRRQSASIERELRESQPRD